MALRGDGFTAWWFLLKEFEPETQRFAVMVGRITRYELPDSMMKALGDPELLIKADTDQRSETVADNVKIGVVVSGIKSESFATHLALNASKFTNHDELRHELRAIASAQRSGHQRSRSRTHDHADGCDAMHQGKTGKDSKGKGRGQGSNDKGNRSNKGGKGVDDGNAKKKEIRNCHCCGKAGNSAAYCRKKTRKVAAGRSNAWVRHELHMRQQFEPRGSSACAATASTANVWRNPGTSTASADYEKQLVFPQHFFCQPTAHKLPRYSANAIEETHWILFDTGLKPSSLSFRRRIRSTDGRCRRLTQVRFGDWRRYHT